VFPLVAGLVPNRLGAEAVVPGAAVPDVVLEGGFPPKPPKSPEVEVAGAVVLGAVVIVLPGEEPNRPVVEEGVEEAAGLGLLKRLELPVAGVEEPAVVFGVPKRLPAAGADDVGCEVGVLLWKWNDGCEAVAAGVDVAAVPELVGVVEFKPLNRLLDPVDCKPKSPPEGAGVLENSVEVLAGVCAESEAFGAPNNGVD
jgi:hypothetical protein